MLSFCQVLVAQYYHWACTHAGLGFLGPFHRFWAPLSHFILMGILSLFHHFQAPLSYLGSFVPFYSFRHPQPVSSLLGSFVPFVFPWASQARLLSLGFLGPFPNFASPWAFIEFFVLSRPNYVIPHPWGSCACYQPLTFFVFITLGMLRPILTFSHHILPMVCFFSLSELF